VGVGDVRRLYALTEDMMDVVDDVVDPVDDVTEIVVEAAVVLSHKVGMNCG